jgi:glyoxylase-like metal-dependent hydrolase (beta-lactamase superfamily II)
MLGIARKTAIDIRPTCRAFPNPREFSKKVGGNYGAKPGWVYNKNSHTKLLRGNYMKPVEIVPGVHQLPMGIVSTYLIDSGGDLTLIDCGIQGSAPGILQAIEELGRRPEELRQILFTHLHADHTGGAKAMQAATGAKLYMHPIDRAEYLKGVSLRPNPQTRGFINRMVVGMMVRSDKPAPEETAQVEGELADGETLPFAGGLKVIHTPGHTAGHVVFLWPKEGGVLFAGDACSNFTRLGQSMLYEDTQEGMRSLEKISGLAFETACPSHGRVIKGGAGEIFRRKWKS